MSQSSINDKLRQLASDIQTGVDNSELVNAIAMQNKKRFSGRLFPDLYSVDRANGFLSRCIMVKPKHTGFIVLQRLQHHDGRQFIAPTFCETKPEADMFASNFDNVVAIMPIEWEE